MMRTLTFVCVILRARSKYGCACRRAKWHSGSVCLDVRGDGKAEKAMERSIPVSVS